MASKRAQTMAKRARELAVKEKRDLKRARKAEAAAQRADGDAAELAVDADSPEDENGAIAAAESSQQPAAAENP
jgi:hypothetical protein